MPRLLLRLLAGVHLVAFVSLWVQIDGLIGSRGILPAREFFTYLERALGGGTLERLANAPSLLWFSSSDAALHALCAAGVLLALLAIAGMTTAPVFGALWICYLSLVWGGQTFLAFQWDTLLLEATLCAAVLGAIAPFRSINGYGLFRAMTTSRPEIVIEASADGVTWNELAFRFKPGDLNRPPRAAQPHMPRLDWQMWFAALDPGRADWLGSFVARLFEGESAVLGLLGEASRQAEPPAYVRLRLYDYTFSEPGAGASWWRRELLYDLSPVLEREAFVQTSSEAGSR